VVTQSDELHSIDNPGSIVMGLWVQWTALLASFLTIWVADSLEFPVRN